MRRRWLAIAALGGSPLACAFGLDGYTGGGGGGGPDGNVPFEAAVDVAIADATPASDAADAGDGGRCPTGKGPAMVAIPTDAGSFCIDGTEVTNDHYRVFLNTTPLLSSQPGPCAFNATFAPGDEGLYDDPANASLPVVNVNWCDAYAFCAWAGKRLCGRIGGGGLYNDVDRANVRISEMGWTCSHASNQLFPYGLSWDRTACNVGSQNNAAVASYPKCVGGFPGVYDIVGNVGEWLDDCSTTNQGVNDSCPTNNTGFYTPTADDSRKIGELCSHFDAQRRGDKYFDLGFRCCAD